MRGLFNQYRQVHILYSSGLLTEAQWGWQARDISRLTRVSRKWLLAISSSSSFSSGSSGVAAQCIPLGIHVNAFWPLDLVRRLAKLRPFHLGNDLIGHPEAVSKWHTQCLAQLPPGVWKYRRRQGAPKYLQYVC